MDEAAEDALLDALHLAPSTTLRAGVHLAPRARPPTMTYGADLQPLHPYLLITSEDGLLKGEGEAVVAVYPPLRGTADLGAYPAEEGLKDIPQAACSKAPKGLPPLLLTVIGCPLLRMGEDLVGFIELLERFLGPGSLVVVGMALKSQPPEGPLYLLLAGIPGDTQDLVVILLRSHNITFYYSTRACPPQLQPLAQIQKRLQNSFPREIKMKFLTISNQSQIGPVEGHPFTRARGGGRVAASSPDGRSLALKKEVAVGAVGEEGRPDLDDNPSGDPVPCPHVPFQGSPMTSFPLH